MTGNDLTIYSLRGAAMTFGVFLAVFAFGFLVELPRRRRARDRRRAAYAEAWRAEYLVGCPLVDVVPRRRDLAALVEVPTSGPTIVGIPAHLHAELHGTVGR